MLLIAAFGRPVARSSNGTIMRFLAGTDYVSDDGAGWLILYPRRRATPRHHLPHHQYVGATGGPRPHHLLVVAVMVDDRPAGGQVGHAAPNPQGSCSRTGRASR